MTHILRSYQVYGADDQILKAASDAILDALKDAKSSAKVQRVALRRRGHRQDLEIGDAYVVPAGICDHPADFPTAILYANLRRHATGEGMVEFQMGTLVEPGEISKESLQALKDVAFTNAKGDAAPLIVFAPSWAHPADYQSFVYEGEDALIGQLREVAYAAPFNPSLSSVFDQLKAVDCDQSPITVNIPGTQHIFRIPASEEPDYPTFARGLDIATPEGSKKASLGRRPVVRLTAADLPTAEKAILEDDELSLFESVDQQVSQAVKSPAAVAASLCVASLEQKCDPHGPQDHSAQQGEYEQRLRDLGGSVMDKAEAQRSTAVREGLEAFKSQHQASFRIANTKTKQVWAAVDVDGVKFGGDWSDDVTEAAEFISKEAADDEIRRNFLSRGEATVVEEPCGCKECTCKKEAASAPGPWVVIDEATGEVKATCKNRGEATKIYNRLNAPRFRGDEGAPSYEMKAKSYHDEMQPKGKEAKWKRASNWYNPGSVLEQFAPELAGSRVDSPFLNQQENEAGYINPFGAPGKGTAQDNTGMGLNQEIADGAGNTVPLRQENNFYGPDFARNFYAPHTDIAPGALTTKKRQAASRKKADSSLSLFQGLAVANPETDGDYPDEHPQAHVDERAADGQTSTYEDPGAEVSMQDPLFIQMDQFVKQVLAAYASQLISAFQVTARPISLGVPFEDTLDLADLIRYAGGSNVSESARDAAVTQLVAGMNKLNDGQRRFLLENAFAQAAVWCNGTGASGGFNYEVYVRATEVGETTMKIVVVTGQKGQD